ncbi:uncharacterized protein LOC131680609 [Topomyia yanbarensis]|uniref:uncharacterized protein LOC131680609 n=1 Tax=Topomyia yanbarensis TaxID=2498891 RepID=UPI00273B0C08|nr:uncharacterized protein LOC131680609 [Topomyia yanbarensis]
MGKKLKPKIHVRDSVVDFLQRTAKFLNSMEAPDENQIKFRLEKLEVKWNEFEEIQSEIEEADDHEGNVEAHRQIRADFEEQYFVVRAGLVSKLPRQLSENTAASSSSLPSSDSSSVHAYVRLPQINLPEFDGNFEKWLPFHDTFRALIDSSPELSNIQKFHYLRSSLRGEALKLVDSYPMSDANYRVAWDGLVARFSNSYLLKKRHLNALFEYPKVKRESASGIHDVIDCFERNTKILDQLGEKTNGWGAMLTHLLVSKLDDVTQKQWEKHASAYEDPNFMLLIEFLKNQTRVLDAVSVDQCTSSSHSFPSTSGYNFRSTKVSINSVMESKGPSCASCQEQHSLTQCPIFHDLPVDDRLQFTNAKRLCSNCLGRNHLARDCPSRFRCRTCSKKHHTLLHPGFPGSGTTPTPSANHDNSASCPTGPGDESNSGLSISSSIASISSNVVLGSSGSYVFLMTAVIEVKDRWGKTHLARALLDSGSQANIMSEDLCQLLKLQRTDKKVEISGIGRSRKQTSYKVVTTVSSRIQNFSLPMEFLVLGHVTDDQPSSSLPLSYWTPPSDMELADPQFYQSGPVDIVLGSQYFYEYHLLNGGRVQIRKFQNTLPVFVNTVFGWVAAGETDFKGTGAKISCHLATVEHLDAAIERFWAIEELTDKPPRSQQEEDCESHFQNTVSRDITGRYIVQYPKRMGFHKMVGASMYTALHRFQQLERRLNRDPELRKQYDDFLQEYINMGHMRLVCKIEDAQNEKQLTCYLPHHPVLKESSSTTKLRVVFDGSAKTSTNHSLNDALLTGPVIQDELLDIMIRFKTSDPIQIYELQTVTYGLSPSSYLATRVLQQVAKDDGNNYKLAAAVVMEDFYMDDFLCGADSIENAKKLRCEVQTLMAGGGFQLRKWSSNEWTAISDSPSEAIDGQSTLYFDPEQKVKTLGVSWETASDQFCIEVRANVNDDPWTKRKIFSAIAQLYDPLGLVSPVVVYAKIQMQSLWLASCNWDDLVPKDIQTKWEQLYQQLPLLEQFKVPRRIFAEGQLPKSRTAPSRPFAITGVDFCGPVYLKPVHRRAAAQKAYIAVFVCFTTKATHLELVCDLSTNAFIAALHRFVARRGVPAEIHSDNGTNFKGAKNVLNELYYMLNNHQEAIVNECTAKGITWKFIPPRAPNFGGLWEAAVKTAKTSMVKTIGNTSLSYEDFLTVLTQIEANMNARPLTPLSDDPTELDVLTPSHFLTGSSLTSLPDPDYTKVPSNRLKHYQQLQQLIQKHWIRWRNEYLTELNVQRKKSPATMHVRVGQIVLVHDESKPSIAWPLARIEAITPGQDNIVRVATVRTKSGIYTRPVRKLYPLPFCSEADIKQNEHNTEAVVTEICS